MARKSKLSAASESEASVCSEGHVRLLPQMMLTLKFALLLQRNLAFHMFSTTLDTSVKNGSLLKLFACEQEKKKNIKDCSVLKSIGRVFFFLPGLDKYQG